jgi:SAM-dependent methyltransferase
LGKQPLANSYHKGEKLPTYPLEVMVCKNCFHSQLSKVINPDSMFRNYLYVSGTTKTFRDHCLQLAKDAVKRFPKRNLSVLDIACNDGTQLAYFRDLGCSVFGVDPAENLRKITLEKKIPVDVAYWTKKVAHKINKKFDIITGTNVFAHVNDLDEFLDGVKIALAPNGVFIVEFPYANKMIENNEFDTVYHEHLSYFLVNSFKTLMDRKGLYIDDIIQTSIHGGSIRFFVKIGSKQHCKKTFLLIEDEKNKGLFAIKTYQHFLSQVKKNKMNLKKLLNTLRKSNHTVIGYGASAKGNTMLNYFKIKLDYIVDDNPLKWGYKTPGRDIPIENPEKIKLEKDGLQVLVLSWNFCNEIIKNVMSLRGKNRHDNYITYIPTIKSAPIKHGAHFIHSA